MNELSRIKWLSAGTQVSALLLFPLHTHGQVQISELGSLGGSSINAYHLNQVGQVVGNASTTGNLAQHAFLFHNGTMFDLGTLGGSSGSAFSVNASGHAVGIASTTRDLAVHAFLHNGTNMTDLGTLGGTFSSAVAVNDRGQVAGDSQLANGFSRAFLYSAGVMRDLGTLGGSYSAASALNAHGWVAGDSATANDAESHAFVFDGLRMHDVGTLGGTFSLATGLNDNGEVVGESTTAMDAEVHAFVFRANQMVDLGTLGGTYSTAYAVNSSGMVIGDSFTVDDMELRAFATVHGTMIDLGTLGGDYSSSWAVNDRGQVVGESNNSSQRMRAFVWEDGVMTDLNSLLPPNSGWVLFAARLINNAGQIVGVGTYNGVFTWFILTPEASAPNAPPVADAGPDLVAECAGLFSPVLLDGSRSTDPENQSLTYVWSWNGTVLGTGATLAAEFPGGFFTVTLQVTDSENCTSTDTVGVLVRDSIAPTVTCPAEVRLAADATGRALLPNVVGQVVASDNCSAVGALQGTQTPVAGTALGVGVHSVVVTVTDESGNRAQCSASVRVEDLAKPRISGPVMLTVPVQAHCQGQVPNLAEKLAFLDNVTPVHELVVVQSPVPGTPVGVGNHTATVMVTDAAGNTATASVELRVVDTQVPSIRSIAANPAAIWPATGKMVSVTLTVNAVDNCELASTRIVSVTRHGVDAGSDAVVTGPLSLQLRARKADKKELVAYQIIVECHDASGNATRGAVTVEVARQ